MVVIVQVLTLSFGSSPALHKFVTRIIGTHYYVNGKDHQRGTYLSEI